MSQNGIVYSVDVQVYGTIHTRTVIAADEGEARVIVARHLIEQLGDAVITPVPIVATEYAL